MTPVLGSMLMLQPAGTAPGSKRQGCPWQVALTATFTASVRPGTIVKESGCTSGAPKMAATPPSTPCDDWFELASPEVGADGADEGDEGLASSATAEVPSMPTTRHVTRVVTRART